MSLLSRKHNMQARQVQSFTLVEMMAVLTIIVIVLAVSAPAFQKLTSGSAVRAGTRVVAAQVRLARQFAISQRKTVALVMPGPEVKSVNNLNDDLKYTAMRAAIVTGSSAPFTFDKWIANTTWLYVPNGATIAEADNDKGVASASGVYSEFPSETTSTYAYVQIPQSDLSGLDDNASFAATQNVRAIVFNASGRIIGNTDQITIAQITYASSNWVKKNKDKTATGPGDPSWCTPNQFNIAVNNFTGRIKIEEPAEY